MDEPNKWKLHGKSLPILVLSPFLSYFPCRLDNSCYVHAYPVTALLLTVFFGLLALPGIPLFLLWSGMEENTYLHLAVAFLFFGGAGCIMTYSAKHASYSVLDRQKREVRFWGNKKLGAKRKIVKAPFEECEARIKHAGLGRTSMTISHEKGQVMGVDVHGTDSAVGILSFIVQFMDKEAPLPDTGPFAPYANRSKGVGPVEKWEIQKETPGFIDPLKVWWGHWPSDPPAEARKIYAAYEPRRMPVNVAIAPDATGEHLVTEPHDKKTLLPKQVLRPFELPDPILLDENSYTYKRPAPDGRYYYLANWIILCAGIALLAVNTVAAIGTVAAAVVLFFGIRKLHRSKGTILDRKNGLVIFHQGLSFAPRKLPFDECECHLTKTEHVEGFNSYQLHLYHPTHGSYALDNGDFLSLDLLLGFWSFIVQYMDKDAPLPRTKETEHLDDTTPGVGPWDKWAREAVSPGFVDPFALWLQSVEGEASSDRSRVQEETILN